MVKPKKLNKIKPKLSVSKQWDRRVGKNAKQVSFNIKMKSGNEYIDYSIDGLKESIKLLKEALADKGIKNYKLSSPQLLLPTGTHILNTTDFEDEYEDDYFDSNVKDTSKFEKIIQANIIVTY